MTSTAFSNSGEDVIQRNVDVEKSSKTDSSKIQQVYEISRSTDWIKQNQFKRVALQFPDHLLVDSTAVAAEISKLCDAKVFILGDTSYGSCCVDEVAAQHYNAESIIHYGSSCLSPTSRYPVLYVFGQRSLDPQHCCEQLSSLLPDKLQKLVLFYDVQFLYTIEKVMMPLQMEFPNLVVSHLEFPENARCCTEVTVIPCSPCSIDEIMKAPHLNKSFKPITNFGRTFHIDPSSSSLEDYTMLYIGDPGLTLTNLMMTYNRSQFFTYNPTTLEARKETLNVSQALMKRYTKIEKAKDAGIVGIVAGTLGVSDYLSVIAHLKKIIKAAGKKSYTFVMGKLNVAKMANFMEVDVFVLVACPENSLLDTTEFYKPVVTPFEMELACNQAREWTGDYVTDFRQILPGAASFVDLPESSGEATYDMSLVTGRVRSMGVDDESEQASSSTAVVKRDDMMAVSTTQAATAGEFLQSRSWQGLEQKLGETPVVKATEGRKGIALGYTHEPGKS